MSGFESGGYSQSLFPYLEHGTKRPETELGPYELVHMDAFEWLKSREPMSIHGVVTDPPYGVVEYTRAQLEKRANGRGGVWRIPPSFDGSRRSPVPRFTVLSQRDIEELWSFFETFARLLMPVLVPGAHVMLATNPLVSQYVYLAMIEAGFEKRGEIIRLVQTLRGGDRPKNAEQEFTMVTVMPRSCWEPWGLFRKPCEGRVQDNLRSWGTGGLRRPSPDQPFRDVIVCPPARGLEKRIAPHPSLKPQLLMRQLVHAILPLGKGVILDPFAGSGSTIAAASALGLQSIGIEIDLNYYELACRAVPELARIRCGAHQRG